MFEKIITDPEICDEWWELSRMSFFSRTTKAYPTTYLEEILIVAISEIEPVKRNRENGPFDKQRMLNILRGFAGQSAIPPVVVRKKDMPGTYKYELVDGFHRYYASIAADFTKIPTILVS